MATKIPARGNCTAAAAAASAARHRSPVALEGREVDGDALVATLDGALTQQRGVLQALRRKQRARQEARRLRTEQDRDYQEGLERDRLREAQRQAEREENERRARAEREAREQAELEAARQLAYRAVDLCARGENATREISMAKLICGELACKVADRCLQFHGGAGYMDEYPISRFWRDTRLITIGGGTSEIMREIISKVQGL